MEREIGAQRVVKDGREGIVVERESASVKVRWADDGSEEWVVLADVREQASDSTPPRELGS